MILKRLIFIWLGSEIPDYGKFCMETFKKVNPDFEIMLVHELDVDNTRNEDLKACLDLVHSSNDNIYKHMLTRKFATEKILVNGKVGLDTAVSDAFRLYLLDKYGGIYLDLDTFPVNAFDDQLLAKDGFTVNHKKHHCDYFFMGFCKDCVKNGLIGLANIQSNKGQIFDFSRVSKLKYPECLFNALKQKRLLLEQKFRNNSLQVGESLYNKQFPTYYIDHFRIGAWRI